MNTKYFLYILLLSSILLGEDSPNSWKDYWHKSAQSILNNKSNQIILSSAALSAFAATTIDMRVKSYTQSHGLLSDPVSHFGDLYGGKWGHWVLWSSIIVTSKMNNESKSTLISKMQFSTLAMVTNGIITESMKRSFGRTRPNGSCCKSFPSGHTSHSFTMAAIANKLYGKEMGLVTYGLATLVAMSRVNDNKHYLSDVIFGAALGTVVGRSFAMNYRNSMGNNLSLNSTPQFRLQLTIPL
ncbi:MAG: phosphatase PAP2 family protein [Candidatus Marinimicrobia bacterium]|nr:phosphatase PAP2 family protein [Candidatus Neomarinimicrobiota bacterium]